jgi:hypothetical protein
VVDRAGAATVVWAGRWRGGYIWASRLPAGGTWGRPVAVGRGTDPRVAVQRNGAVTVAYITTRTGRTDGVSVVRRPPGGPWSDPTHLTRDVRAPGYDGPDGEGQYGAMNLELAVNARGAGVATWVWGSYDRNKPYRIQGSYRSGSGAWGPTRRLSEPLMQSLYSYRLELGIDRRGNVTLIWGGSARSALHSLRRVVGAGWQPAIEVATKVRDWNLTVDPRGNATALLTRRVEGSSTVAVAVRRADESGWRGPRRISIEGGRYSQLYPQMVVDARGTVSASWIRDDASVRYLRHPLGVPWPKPVTVGRATGVWATDVAVNAAGDVVVVWSGTRRPMTGRYRDHAAGWTRPFAMVAKGQPSADVNYDVTVGPSGAAFFVWTPGSTGPLLARTFR